MRILESTIGMLVLVACAEPPADEASVPVAQGKADIWGEDERVEPYTVEPTEALARGMHASVALVPPSSLRVSDNGRYVSVNVPSLQAARRLCPGENFAAQPVLAYCSGTLIAPDLVATAGHCLDACDASHFVFGYGYATAPEDPFAVVREFASAQVYHCKRVEAHAYDEATHADYALVRLDRPVTVAAPVRRGLVVAEGQRAPATVIGYPHGLPQKLAQGTLEPTADGLLSHDADTLPRGSGSGVFNQAGELVGIHISGSSEGRFYPVDNGRCNAMRTCGRDVACEHLNKAFPLSRIDAVLDSLGGPRPR